MNHVYGYCPRCGGLGMSRERRKDGNDRCENGHSYPSSTAVTNPLLPVAPATKRADSLALAYREQQGENDALRAANNVLLAERDLYREAWAKAQAHLDCGADATDAQRERAAVVAWLRSRGMADYAQSNLDYAATMIERGEHRREEKE